jgi:hypothetical protein
MVGVAAEDDDGNEASGKPSQVPQGKTTRTPVSPNPQQTGTIAPKPNVTQAKTAGEPVSFQDAHSLGEAAKVTGWTKGELTHYAKTRWNVKSSVDLKRPEYEEFLKVVRYGDYKLAMSALEVGLTETDVDKKNESSSG